MFVAIMRVLHSKLPCSKNFFVLRQKYFDARKPNSNQVRRIASPTIMKHFSPIIFQRPTNGSTPPVVRFQILSSHLFLARFVRVSLHLMWEFAKITRFRLEIILFLMRLLFSNSNLILARPSPPRNLSLTKRWASQKVTSQPLKACNSST